MDQLFARTARTVDPLVATRGRLSIAEAESVLEDGHLDPDAVEDR